MNNHKRTSIPGLARRLASLAALSLGLASTLPASAQPAPAAPPAPPSTTTAAPLPPPPPPPESAASTEEQPTPKPPRKTPKLSNETWDNRPQQPPMWAPIEDPNLPVLPRRIDYEDGDILLPGYELKTRATRSLVVAGLVTFAVPYGLSALVGGAYAFGDQENYAETYGPLLVPVFGPFISLGVENAQTPEFPNPRSSEDDIYTFFMLLNGFTQMT
ncbi:MAG TPA: hypothetical protein VM694_16165, partial [Polyangium sp.]|nr:hypothetical protein [Polyangium sp.]